MQEMFEDEEKLLGVPPEMTEDAQRAATIAHAIVENESVFSRQGEPSNAHKMMHIRSVFNSNEATIHQPCELSHIFTGNLPGMQQAAAFLADLRCQYIKKLLEENIINPMVGNLWLWRNRVWYVRLREQMSMHIEASYREQGGNMESVQ